MLLLAEDCSPEDLLTVWKALEAVCLAIPKDNLPEYVNCLKVRHTPVVRRGASVQSRAVHVHKS